MVGDGAAAVGGRLTDWISVGVLAASVPRDVVDEAVMVCDRQPRRSDGKLPAHVMVYFAMALALFAEDDYEGVLARLAEPLMQWGCWDRSWSMPGSAGITQARQRLGSDVVREVFERVARPVCEQLTRGPGWPGGGWCRSTGSSVICRTALRTGSTSATPAGRDVRRSRKHGW
ncbi:transposase domain-containing protein [Phytohabitans flavus]|uniref:transposase domain-containing protein n=1 Tax=Phytohabitans flavus TaxID=1076124 RepID=UPI00362CFE22